ncbi:hypothetical protein GQR58_008802 [Nymphon striatum]|nr:hypothetical protein GQR58_008802 [Nymphon striatum]
MPTGCCVPILLDVADGVPMGGKCFENFACDQWFSACKNGVCQCLYGNETKNGVIKCFEYERHLSISCDSMKCNKNNSYCDNNQCTCNIPYAAIKAKNNTKICKRVLHKYPIPIGERCFFGCGDKENIIVCHNTYCMCKNGYAVSINNTLYCRGKKIASYAESAEMNVRFIDAADDHAHCSENKCVCDLLYRPRNMFDPHWFLLKRCVQDPTALPFYCDKKKECKAVNSRCSDGKCLCLDGYQAIVNSTTKQCSRNAKVGENCTAFDIIPHSSKCESGFVQCLPKFKEYNDNSSCALDVGIMFNETCQADFQCQINTSFSICNEVTKECGCDGKAEYTDNKCITSIDPLQKCSEKTVCLSNSECSDDICKCKSGYNLYIKDKSLICKASTWTSFGTVGQIFVILGPILAVMLIIGVTCGFKVQKLFVCLEVIITATFFDAYSVDVKYILRFKVEVVIKRKVDIGGKCNKTEDCYDYGSTYPNIVCDESKCFCNTTQVVSNVTYCIIGQDLNTTCKKNSDCKVLTSKCSNATCSCLPGYAAIIVPGKPRQCSWIIKYEGTLGYGGKCTSYDALTENAICRNGTVHCAPSFIPPPSRISFITAYKCYPDKDKVVELVRCSCGASNPSAKNKCASGRCSCRVSALACTELCQCEAEANMCQNMNTNTVDPDDIE